MAQLAKCSPHSTTRVEIPSTHITAEVVTALTSDLTGMGAGRESKIPIAGCAAFLAKSVSSTFSETLSQDNVYSGQGEKAVC